MAHLRPLTVAVLLGLSVAACSSAPPEPHFPPISFANEPALSFNVAHIEVVNAYKSPDVHPNIEFEVPVSPEEAIHRWARDRLKAVGQSGTLRVLIRNASATETPLKTDLSFAGNFKKEEVARVDMNLDVAVQLLDERQFVVAEVSQTNGMSQTELDGMKLNERDKLLYDLVNDMTHEFDRRIDPSIHSNLGNWLVNP